MRLPFLLYPTGQLYHTDTVSDIVSDIDAVTKNHPKVAFVDYK